MSNRFLDVCIAILVCCIVAGVISARLNRVHDPLPIRIEQGGGGE